MVSGKWLINTVMTAALGAALTLGADLVANGRIESGLTETAAYASTSVDGLMRSVVAATTILATQWNADTQVQAAPVEAKAELFDNASASTVIQSDTTSATGSAASGVTSAQIIIGADASLSNAGEAGTSNEPQASTIVGAQGSGTVSVQASNAGLRLKKLVNGLTGSLGLGLEGQTDAELTQ